MRRPHARAKDHSQGKTIAAAWQIGIDGGGGIRPRGNPPRSSRQTWRAFGQAGHRDRAIQSATRGRPVEATQAGNQREDTPICPARVSSGPRPQDTSRTVASSRSRDQPGAPARAASCGLASRVGIASASLGGTPRTAGALGSGAAGRTNQRPRGSQRGRAKSGEDPSASSGVDENATCDFSQSGVRASRLPASGLAATRFVTSDIHTTSASDVRDRCGPFFEILVEPWHAHCSMRSRDACFRSIRSPCRPGSSSCNGLCGPGGRRRDLRRWQMRRRRGFCMRRRNKDPRSQWRRVPSESRELAQRLVRSVRDAPRR